MLSSPIFLLFLAISTVIYQARASHADLRARSHIHATCPSRMQVPFQITPVSQASCDISSTLVPGHTGHLGQLFPVGYDRSWTTCPESKDAFELSDQTLRPTKVLRGTVHSYENAPDGIRAMKAHFPKGSYTFSHTPLGGFSFYAPGPPILDIVGAKEVTFGYSVYFPEGFAFNKGGKLPGLYGGNSAAESSTCSGGRCATACFSSRIMWRGGGDGELYTYLPPGHPANDKLCNVPPFSKCHPKYGASVSRGAFRFATGAWTIVSQRLRLNDVGRSNGEIQLFVNGKSVIEVKGLVLRDGNAGRIRGIQAQTFFGGSTVEWASPKDQDIYFADFSVAVVEPI